MPPVKKQFLLKCPGVLYDDFLRTIKQLSDLTCDTFTATGTLILLIKLFVSIDFSKIDFSKIYDKESFKNEMVKRINGGR